MVGAPQGGLAGTATCGMWCSLLTGVSLRRYSVVPRHSRPRVCGRFPGRLALLHSATIDPPGAGCIFGILSVCDAGLAGHHIARFAHGTGTHLYVFLPMAAVYFLRALENPGEGNSVNLPLAATRHPPVAALSAVALFRQLRATVL